ncbi:hypothetical protein [Lyngbya sp. PCC 8106]|uniref:hypothetical protein n=1 Tax=Lyngbya sp. (strain PCC 8106) TaxID=313612 RepID=UPI0002E296D4|nr:hypothetical protein [Lyngbya sp. PCC 8106]
MSKSLPTPEEYYRIMFGLDDQTLVAKDSSFQTVFNNDLSSANLSENVCENEKDKFIENWTYIFRDKIYTSENKEYLVYVLECLKSKNKSINIHRLEKDLMYLISLALHKRNQLLFSFPVSPVALGILSILYYTHLPPEARYPEINQSLFAKRGFIIWVRPKNNGQILKLTTTKEFNFNNEYTDCNIRDRLTCLPAYQFDELSKSKTLRAVMVRSLSEATELLKQSQYCSFVVIDDPSGCTHRSPYQYGNETFKLTQLCQKKKIPLIGIVPPWAMKHLDYQENNNSSGILLWPVDFFALRSYPKEPRLFNPSSQNQHPIEESFSKIERKHQSLREAQVIIKTFNFETEDEEKIADLFRESSELLVSLAKQSELRRVWGTGWEIWRHLSAPVLPFYLLWEKFIEGDMKRLQLATQQSKIDEAQRLYSVLSSLALRLRKIKHNPFISIVESANQNTTIGVTHAAQANALEYFLKSRKNYFSSFKVLPLSQIRGENLGGDKLIVLGQPKASNRDILQKTFFSEIDVLLWSVFAGQAERWWINLEVDTRKWNKKTWMALTEEKTVGCYGFSPQSSNVKVIPQGTVQLYKQINFFKLEERFCSLSQTSYDSELDSYNYQNLEEYYEVKFKEGWKIRVPPQSEFLTLLRGQVHIVAVNELSADIRVVLFDGMNRDALFAQKAGLLDDTTVNYVYRVQLNAWRELVKQRVKKLGMENICRDITAETEFPIGRETIQYNWMNGNDLLSLPRKKEHFFWFIPPLVRSNFEEFWEKANDLRNKRRQLGQIISTCAQEGWKNRKPEEIIFQYQQVSITVGELREAMQFLIVQSPPKLIHNPPISPFNRLFNSWD